VRSHFTPENPKRAHSTDFDILADFPDPPRLEDLENPTLSLVGLLELLDVLVEETATAPGLIPMWAEELRRELAAHQGVE
jgi:hypothetical protein